MTAQTHLPDHADTIVIGGGSAGAAVAGLLAEHADGPVLLLEAGPDYGPRDSGRWPANLLDARALGYTDAWDYDSADTYPGRRVPFERARVIGGCSSHNGCAAIWGSRLDYDAWAALGLPGWATDDLLPLFHAAAKRLRVRAYEPQEVTPFQRACLDAAPAVGVPLVDDLNDLDQPLGIAPSPVNIDDGVRINTAFAYLDPVRDRPNLTVLGDAPVLRLLVDRSRVSAVVVATTSGPRRIETGRVILCGGAYGSPTLLLHSGVGNADALRSTGIAPTLDLPGVGQNLHDHPSVIAAFAGTPELERRSAAYAAQRWSPEEQTIAKARSSRCADGFDLHLYPVGGPDPDRPGAWRWKLPVACMTPRSRGFLALCSPDPSVPPRIDHRYLSDPDGHDRAVLVDGLRLARLLAAQPPLRDLLGPELSPGPHVTTTPDLDAFVDAEVLHYYHPVGTCAMGPASDPAAVVDARGKIHGLDNAYVADCSVMPTVPRANTNIPAVVVGERVARWLLPEPTLAP